MTWLITGGAGYIGAHVVSSFLAKGINCAVLDDFSSGVRSRVPETVTIFEGDICDRAVVARALAPQPFEGIVHLAAKKSVEEVAKENGYKYVIDSSQGMLLYADASDDIMALVKKKMGLNAAPSTTEAPKK